MARRTRITIETDSILVVGGKSSLRAWCEECREEVAMIPLDGVGVISNLMPPEVEAWMASEELHHSQTSAGELLICLNSMLKRVHQ